MTDLRGFATRAGLGVGRPGRPPQADEADSDAFDQAMAHVFLSEAVTYTELAEASGVGVSTIKARLCRVLGRDQVNARRRRIKAERKSPPRRTVARIRSAMRRLSHPIASDVTPEFVAELTAENRCSYCGGTLPVFGVGLDRMDSSRPYERGNIVPCCSLCNEAKGYLLTQEEFAAAMAVRVARTGDGQAWEGSSCSIISRNRAMRVPKKVKDPNGDK